MSRMLMTPSRDNLQRGNRPMIHRGDDIEPVLLLRREMDRVFDDVFRGFGMPSFPLPFGRVPVPALAPGLVPMLAPHIDVSETDQEVRIAAELPGINEQDVEVNLSDDILTIRGEKRVEEAEQGRDYRIVERARGSFSRSIRLPFTVDPGSVRAMVNNGLLTITIPKPREVREKTSRIEVMREDSSDANTTSATAGESAQGTPAITDLASAQPTQERAAE